MTLAEAKKIAEIVKTADGGCESCVFSLVELLNEKFTKFEWRMIDPSDRPHGTKYFYLWVDVKFRRRKKLGGDPDGVGID